MIQSRRDVAHEAHHEKGYLEDRIRNEVHSADDFIIPRHGVEVDEEREEP